MPSCSSSSNIQASITALNTTQGGSRLIVSVPKLSGTGLTFGNVIRYDVPTSGYTWSKADSASNSEVFGVIEGLDTAENFSVVIYGSINLSSSQLFDMGSGGGSGGNDIYFLSGTTAGALQNLAPTNLDHIIKPVYQVSPHGSYSGVVINYLGYRIGGDIEAVSDDYKGIGEIRVYVGNANFDPGFVDASIHHELPILNYPDFYNQMGKIYGYIEEIILDEEIGSITNGTDVTQNGINVGRITNVNYSTKTIRLRKNPNQPQITTGAPNLRINSTNFTPLSTTVYASITPKVALGSALQISGLLSNNSSTSFGIPQQTKVGIKVQPTGVSVTIPKNITTPSLTATVIEYGTAETDLETIINNLDSRITDLES